MLIILFNVIRMMRKIYIGIIVSAAALIGYIAFTTLAATQPQPAESGSVVLSLGSTMVDYNDTQTWTAKIPENAGYVVTVRPVNDPTIFLIGPGTADFNGDASGSVLIGGNLPAGATNLRVELASDPSIYDEKLFMVGEASPSVALTVTNLQVNYDETQTWNANISPNARYVVTLRPLGNTTVILIGSGTADASGAASSSFVVGRNLSPGPTNLRVELASDPSIFDEKLFMVGEISPSVNVTVASAQMNYDDTQSWNASGLPPDAGYVITLRSLASPVIIVLGSGSADANGEATGSFIVGRNVPAGEAILRIELASLPTYYGEVTFTVG